jgi:hypothetical protein
VSEPLFTAPDAWAGGFYEIALEIGPRSDDRLRAALAALWAHPDLDGCYPDRGREPDRQPRVPPACLEGGSHLLGVARLPNGTRTACGTCLIREVGDGPDWLGFYLPLGSLGTAYPAGPFPFGSESDWSGPWRFEVEDWLAELGLCVARSASFRLGLIGFEVSGTRYAADIAAQGIPDERHIGYLWPSRGSVVYYRRTQS